MRKLAPLRVEAYCPECKQQATAWIHPRLWKPLVWLDPNDDALRVKCHNRHCGHAYWVKVRAIHRARADEMAA